MNHAPPPPSSDEPIKSQRYVVVKFHDDRELPRAPFTYRDLARQLPDDAAAIDEGFTFSPHLASEVSPKLKTLMARAREADPKYRPPNPLAYFRIEVSDEDEGLALVEKLRTWNILDYAYLHPGAVKPPMSDNTVLTAQQVYLDPAPQGIDAHYAWTVAGGNGKGQRLADVEWGWHEGHKDVLEHSYTKVTNPDYYKARNHGTSVLGIVAAHDNNKQCVGIAHGLGHICTVGQWRSATLYVTAPAVFDALQHLAPGDVLLLEAQTIMYDHEHIPLEAEPDVFELVKLATTGGITVVAAAGNGGNDLDGITNDSGDLVFDRDSGAIIVAAASLETAPLWAPADFSCYGERVDCFAQGDRVVTLDTNELGTASDTTSEFGGTSSASAIVAGAALVLQGVAQQNLGHKLQPGELRMLLSDQALNTPPGSPAYRIGLMPNLRRIIARLLALPEQDEPQDDTLEETMKTETTHGPKSGAGKKKAKKNGSKTIYVYLDTSANPPVQVDPMVLGRSKLKWRKEDPDQEFEFVSINFSPSNPFSDIDVDDDKIDVDNDETTGDYEYTILVETPDQTQYSTTESGPPAPGDKPVIRN